MQKIRKSITIIYLSLNPKRIIFNPGTTNPELAEIAEEERVLKLVECSCMLVMLQDSWSNFKPCIRPSLMLHSIILSSAIYGIVTLSPGVLSISLFSVNIASLFRAQLRRAIPLFTSQ